MAYHVELSIEANRELKIAECFFDAIGKRTDFLLDFYEQIEFLEKNPFLFQNRYRDVRIVLFKKFTYSLHYIIRNDRVIILNIYNQIQNF